MNIDALIARRTAFRTLADLLNAGGRYRPSCDVSDPDMRAIADAYDAAQEARGDARRAYRYGEPAGFHVGQRGAMWVNQGRRDVRVIAVRDGRALAVYAMPNGREYAVELLAPITHHDLHLNVRNVSQNNPPAFWRRDVFHYFGRPEPRRWRVHVAPRRTLYAGAHVSGAYAVEVMAATRQEALAQARAAYEDKHNPATFKARAA